jgi:probable DNA repair protein
LLARAEFDAFVLRDKTLLQPKIELGALFSIVLRSQLRPELSILLNHLRELTAILRQQDLAADRTHAEWVTVYHELLEAAGWAARSRDNSVEFQTRRKWEDALDQLATLDFEDQHVSCRSALAALERIAAETLFAPESHHALVQIMGPLESAGSTFDAIWFMRADDLSWPPAASPNPLLPWLLQREFAMPGVDHARDSDHARRITGRIAASAPTVIFSYAQHSADSPQRPSPVLAGLGLEARAASDVAASDAPPALIQLDVSADDTPIPHPPDRVLFGGAGILQSQAACGFRAFAEKRLFASAPEAATLGLDARERGSLVHRVLELFWAEVRTQNALRQMPRPRREDLLIRSIDTALDEVIRRVDPGWIHAYLATERQRLTRLLNLWLDYEATERSPFTVQSREQQREGVSIGPLRIDVRVDRIDLIHGDGSTGQPAGELILDYKTGPATPSDWMGARPDAPQLPLYAVIAEQPHLAGLAFASVRPGKNMGISGYQAYDGVLPDPKKLKADSLEAQIETWREDLKALAESFHTGDARVEPKQYPSTCRYCQQRLLCRLDLTTLAADVNEDFADANDPAHEQLESPTEVESG